MKLIKKRSNTNYLIKNNLIEKIFNELYDKKSIIHRGVFSPDKEEFFYTISDKSFRHFDIRVINLTKKNRKSQNAFINGKYSDHGMSFSPDGNTLLFSSTRPCNPTDFSNRWSLWYSIENKGEWSKPQNIKVPLMEDKSLSHPTITNCGKLYFQVSNADYSEMQIYSTQFKNNQCDIPQQVIINNVPQNKCTPFITADNKYIIFAAIESCLKLYISKRYENDSWSDAKLLSEEINDKNQGNPVLCFNEKIMLFTKEEPDNWAIYQTSFQNLIKKLNFSDSI